MGDLLRKIFIGAKICPEDNNKESSINKEAIDPKLVLFHDKTGTFKIDDWSAYPDDYVPLPDKNKIWTFLEGEEYEIARKKANGANRNLRKSDNYYSDNRLEIHEVEPVKFGGSPADLTNKTAIQGQAHRKYVTPWWNKIRDEVKGLKK